MFGNQPRDAFYLLLQNWVTPEYRQSTNMLQAAIVSLQIERSLLLPHLGSGFFSQCLSFSSLNYILWSCDLVPFPQEIECISLSLGSGLTSSLHWCVVEVVSMLVWSPDLRNFSCLWSVRILPKCSVAWPGIRWWHRTLSILMVTPCDSTHMKGLSQCQQSWSTADECVTSWLQPKSLLQLKYELSFKITL